jgi:hypothetical protein
MTVLAMTSSNLTNRPSHFVGELFKIVWLAGE